MATLPGNGNEVIAVARILPALISLYLALAAGLAPLSPGTRGAPVATVQAALGLPTTGTFGAATAAAVRAFQASHGLTPDGSVGPITLAALLGPSLGETLVQEGAEGPLVALLQARLTALGFPPGPADGIFGPRTEAAVRAFQKASGLSVDGLVGPATLSALLDPRLTVVGGDTLSGIAAQYGVSVSALMAANHLTGPLIRIGQELIVPAFPFPSGAPSTSSSIGSRASPEAVHLPADAKEPGVSHLIPASDLAGWGGAATPLVALAVLVPRGASPPILSVPYTVFSAGAPTGPLPGGDVEVAAGDKKAAAAERSLLQRAGLHPRYLLPTGPVGTWVFSTHLTPLLGLTPESRPDLADLAGGEVLLVKDTPGALAALRRLLPAALAAGYRFVTVPDLYR